MKNLFFCFLICISLFSCSSLEIKKEAPFVNEVRVREKFVIKLPEDHRNGNNWQLLQNYNNTVIQQVNEVWHGNEKGIYFHLRGLTKGETTLEFINRNYSDTTDYKAFIVKVVGP